MHRNIWANFSSLSHISTLCILALIIYFPNESLAQSRPQLEVAIKMDAVLGYMPDRATRTSSFPPYAIQIQLNGSSEPTQTQDAQQTTEGTPLPSWIPDGFEFFFQELTTEVDVYFGGVFIYKGLATFTQTELRFLAPEDLAQAIPNLMDEMWAEQILSSPLAVNSDYICLGQNTRNCGTLDPEDIEIIFDPERFQAELFVNSEFLALQTAEVRKYLGESSAGFSVVQSIQAATNGDLNNFSETQYSLQGRSLVSFGETFLQATTNYSDDAGFEIDSLNMQKDLDGMRYRAGLIDPDEGLIFASESQLVGISAGTTLDTREDLRFSTGNTIEVYLPQRSRVSLYRDNRLYSSRFLEAGNHQLDTAALPGGSYDVEIRIEDDTGIRTETRFYSKSPRLPPLDEPQYSFSLGYRADTQDSSPLSTEDDLLWSASYLSRLSPTSAARFAVTGNSDDTVLEIGAFVTARNLQLGAELAKSSLGSTGASLDLSLNLNAFTLRSQYRRTWTDASEATEANLIPNAREQMLLSLTTSLMGGGLSINSRANLRDDGESVRTTSVDYRARTYHWGTSSLTPRFDWAQENGEQSVMFTITLRHSSGRWQFSESAEYTLDNLQSSAEGSGRARASAIWLSPEDWQSRYQADFRASRETDSQSNLGASLNARNEMGQARLDFNQRLGDIEQARWSGSILTTMVLAENKTAFGGREQNRAAIMIDLSESEAEDVFYRVMVDNGFRGIATPGETITINLAPYNTYSVRLEADGMGFASHDNSEREITLYPGNVAYLSWDIEQISVAFGRVLDSEGNAVVNALITGVEGLAVTDSYGNFQAEISGSTPELQVETRQEICTLILPEYSTNRGISLLGDLACDLRPK